MTTTHKFDITAAVGEYKNRDGETKKRWKQVGKILENENGMFIAMDRSFSPAALGEGESCFLSLFEPRKRETQKVMDGVAPGAASQAGIDDDIPF